MGSSSRLGKALVALLAVAAMTRLPLLGAWLHGYAPALFEEPLHNPGLVQHRPVSWPAVAVAAVLLVLMLAPFIKRATLSPRRGEGRGEGSAFRAYGWAGAALVAVSWACSWGVIFPTLRPYAFTPLWLGYIVVVIAIAGRAPKRLLALTLLSAVFWWYFEYLNRFVESWEYSGITVTGPLDVVLFGVLPFATVLPAVAATRELWLPRVGAFERFIVVKVPRVATLLLAALGLLALSWAPTLLYPLVWLAPLFILGGKVFTDLERGDWRNLVSWSLAALTCGFFWELWNWHALPKWTYAVSYLGEPKLFEMPLLGYAGYLFFGWECAAVAALVDEPAQARYGAQP